LGERPTRVKIEASNPPVFVLSGSGKLSVFVMHGPKRQRNIVGDRAYAVWEIKSSRGDENAEDVEFLGAVKYGVVPKNYVQVYPENSAPPPPLVEGERYGYWFQTLNAPHARGYFEIRDGKAVELAK
jgi:hypothetical protein